MKFRQKLILLCLQSSRLSRYIPCKGAACSVMDPLPLSVRHEPPVLCVPTQHGTAFGGIVHKKCTEWRHLSSRAVISRHEELKSS